MAKESKYVTFLSADGEEISNDPRWRAEKVLAEAGVESSNTDNSAELQELIDEQNQELEALRAQLAAKELEEALEDEDEDNEDETDYSAVKGQDLVNLAKERKIELKHADGSKLKAGEVRAALAAQDQAN